MDYKIEKTMDYSKFKFNIQNRAVTKARVKKIQASIESAGYIMKPILVNEKCEIIDGQGRFYACKNLGMPIYYVVQAGIGVEDCRALNTSQTNWSAMDYIQSYAKGGDENYSRLQSLIDSSNLPFSTVVDIIEHKTSHNGHLKDIKEGRFKISDGEKQQCKWVLDYVGMFKEDAKKINGTDNTFFLALAWAYRHLSIDERNRLAEVVKKNIYNFPSFSNIVDFLRYFDKFYNQGKRSKSTKINLELEYRTEKEL